MASWWSWCLLSSHGVAKTFFQTTCPNLTIKFTQVQFFREFGWIGIMPSSSNRTSFCLNSWILVSCFTKCYTNTERPVFFSTREVDVYTQLHWAKEFYNSLVLVWYFIMYRNLWNKEQITFSYFPEYQYAMLMILFRIPMGHW